MSLKLTKRGRHYYVRGTVRGTPCFETCGTTDRKQAEAYKAKREAGLYEKSLFGERAVVTFGGAALSYLEFEDRSQRTKDYVAQLVEHFGSMLAGSIDQAAADRAVAEIVGTDAAPSTKVRVVYTPLSAVLAHSGIYAKFRKPKPPTGKTRWLAPQEAGALIASASPHLRPLLVFFLGTGARVSEALDLQWSDVHLADRFVMLRDTKNGHDRKAMLPPAVVAALKELPHREGAVFRRDDGEPYKNRERLEGGQIKTAFATACKRAQLTRPATDAVGNPKLDADGNTIREPSLTPHDLRHTWATWFYGVSKDLLLLKAEGGWRTLSMVERYSHRMPSEVVPQIARVWGGDHPRIGAKSVQPVEAPAKIA